MDFCLNYSLARRLGHSLCFVALAAIQQASAAPVEKILYDFGIIDGGNTPQAPLTAGPGGVYYGTTDLGGATGNGTVYALIPDAGAPSGWTEHVLYSFSGAKDGAAPASGLLVGKDGGLYGLAASGGAQNGGVAFKLAPPASGQSAWTETTLHDFNGASDGAAPFGTLVADTNGVLYGSTAGGGTGSGGVTFSLTPPSAGQAAWTETVLYSFQFGVDGISPTGGVFLDAATGVIFGMTSAGGLNGYGQVYRLTPPANGGSAWTKTSLYSFRGNTDGNFPLGSLVRDQNGVFYGVTNGGGLSGWGEVFSLAPPEAGRPRWLETVIYHFSGQRDGGAPNSTLARAPDGTLYGTSNAGGDVGEGTVFALTPPTAGKRTWTEAALTSFDGANGVNPAALTRDASGTLVGVTVFGGTLGNGGGTIFALTPPASGASGWTQTVLHQFRNPSRDAVAPIGALLMGKGGSMFGSANSGGASGQGAVFELTPPAPTPAANETAWHETLLHSFSGADGSGPIGTLIEGAHGVLYGVTQSGGHVSAASYGTVYALVPAAGSQGVTWTERVIHSFGGLASGDGAFPAAGLVADAGGALYGTAGSGGNSTSSDSSGSGIVYRLSPPADGGTAWTETVLYRFAGPDGDAPQGSLVFDGSGALYGTTYTGGSAGEGTVFKLTPPASGTGTWTETVLHSFNASIGNDGAIPGQEQLVMDAAGALCGTASQGGLGNSGIVFKLSPPAGAGTDWTETVIHSFTGADGAAPYVGLLARKNGVLLGVAAQGGDFQNGTVFKLIPPGAGATWTTQVLHSFDMVYGQDGADPAGALLQDSKGNLFGTTAAGGYGAGGVVFELTH